jgi:predicted transposase YbfD/YdcC
VHLLAAWTSRLVLAQAAVDGKANEITQFAPLLQPLDPAGCVITAGAMHTQREHADFLVTKKNTHYILALKEPARLVCAG